jgi:D-alanine-D-alanine ligase
MSKKINVGILFGGRSAEHAVSILSARNVISSLDPKKFSAILVYISKDGRWCELSRFEGLELNPKRYISSGVTSKKAKYKNFNLVFEKIDVLFPVLHGPFGEDGTVQGLAKILNIPCVGSGVLGSAIGMDKDVMKRLLREAEIPIANFISLTRSSPLLKFYEVKKKLGLPFFVKPANMGSSIGIGRVETEDDFKTCVEDAFKFDKKIIFEEKIIGREIECSVIGNESPQASLPGEVINTKHKFYDYQAKYNDNEGVELVFPAKLTKKEVATIQAVALKTYQTLEAEGMARVDMFLQKNGQVIVNEINTIPGFTKFSMYPKLWSVSGLPQRVLVNKLINLAIKSFKDSPWNKS